MIKLNDNEVRNIQIDILKMFSKYCGLHDLNYCLYYGTLIGAVRHKGYIPWDDDIDIAMPRPDYEKLIQNFNGFHEDYEVFENRIQENYALPFAKISNKKTKIIELSDINFNNLGVNIDVFPLDGLPESQKIKKSLLRRIKIIRTIYTIKSVRYNRHRSFYKNVILLIGKIIFYFYKPKKITTSIINEALSYDFENSSEVACLVWGYGIREIMKKSYFDKSVKLEFEGEFYNAPYEYDKVLRQIYGDYMQLPPIDKQKSHHDFTAYAK